MYLITNKTETMCWSSSQPPMQPSIWTSTKNEQKPYRYSYSCIDECEKTIDEQKDEEYDDNKNAERTSYGMSIVVGAITEAGLSLSVDSREIFHNGSYTDGSTKLVCENNFLVGFAGLLGTVIDGQQVRTETLIHEAIANKEIKTANDIAIYLFKKLLPALQRKESQPIDMIIGAYEDGILTATVFSISWHGIERNVLEAPEFLTCGEINMVPNRNIIESKKYEHFNESELKQFTHVTAEFAKRNMKELWESGYLQSCTIGGEIHTGFLPTVIDI